MVQVNNQKTITTNFYPDDEVYQSIEEWKNGFCRVNFGSTKKRISELIKQDMNLPKELKINKGVKKDGN